MSTTSTKTTLGTFETWLAGTNLSMENLTDEKQKVI